MIPPGPYSLGEVRSLEELAGEAPVAFTFERVSPTWMNFNTYGHVAEQVVAYRLEKMRRAARRLEEAYARAAARRPE